MKSILFLGDSLTDCDRLYSDDGLGYGYVKLLSEELPYKLINEGFNGFTAGDIRRRLNRTLSYKPDFVSLLVGVNDVLSVISYKGGFDIFAREYEKILSGLSSGEYKTLVVLPFLFTRPAELITWRVYLETMKDEIIRLCKKYRFDYINPTVVFEEKSAEVGEEALTSDGIHLTEFGHRILAEEWLKGFEVLLSK